MEIYKTYPLAQHKVLKACAIYPSFIAFAYILFSTFHAVSYGGFPPVSLLLICLPIFLVPLWTQTLVRQGDSLALFESFFFTKNKTLLTGLNCEEQKKYLQLIAVTKTGETIRTLFTTEKAKPAQAFQDALSFYKADEEHSPI